MNIGASVHKLIGIAEADSVKVKNAILKAVQEVDSVVLPEADKLEPLIAQVAKSIVPGGDVVVNTAYAGLEIIAKLLDAGGAAAEANLANAGLDVAFISQVKTLVPQLKAAAKAQ